MASQQKFGRNKETCTRYKAQNRQLINKEKRIARNEKDVAFHLLKWKLRILGHKPARGTARRIRRHGYAEIIPVVS